MARLQLGSPEQVRTVCFALLVTPPMEQRPRFSRRPPTGARSYRVARRSPRWDLVLTYAVELVATALVLGSSVL
jgi:hypothetical protein